jgi:isoamylase
LPDFARRLHGSSDIFEHSGRKPSASINYVTSHDGFTLNDLVCYTQKHNEANLENNQDGHSENFSDNYGVEGPSDVFEIREVRKRQRRNLLLTLLVAQGTPMLCAGDEMGRTQQGNNNAYCQDGPLSWLNWADATGDYARLVAFVRNAIALRKQYPGFWPDRYVHENDPAGQEILWINMAGEIMQPVHWGQHHTRSLGYLIGCRGLGRLLVLFNAGQSPISFRLPPAQPAPGWQVLLDTGLDDGCTGRPTSPVQGQYSMLAHTTVVLLADYTSGTQNQQEPAS